VFYCGLTLTTATRTSLEARHTDLRLSIGIDIPHLSIVFIFSPRSLVFLRGLILLIFSYFQLKSCINREASIAPASATVPASVCASIFEAFGLLYTFRYTRVGTRLYPGLELSATPSPDNVKIPSPPLSFTVLVKLPRRHHP